VNTTHASVPRTRSARTSRKAGSSCQLSTRRAPPGRRALPRAARGSRRSRGASSAAPGRARRCAWLRLQRALDRLGDPRPPVLHADEDRDPSSRSSARAAPPSPRRAASARRSAGSAPRARRPPRRRPAARRGCPRSTAGCRPRWTGCRRPSGRPRRSRGHHRASCTSRTSRPSSSGSVSGSTPWPRLKMCPAGRRRARARLARRPRPAPTGRAARRRRGSPGSPVVAHQLPGAVDRDPPVDADHVSPRLGELLQQVRRCRFRSGSSARPRPRAPAPSRARRTHGSRRPRAPDPGVEQLDPRRHLRARSTFT
jgi:hypothetical protein